MGRKSKKTKVSKLSSGSKTSLLAPSKTGLFSKVGKNLFAGDKSTTKRRKKTILQLSTELARIKLKKKIQKEKLKG